jgi:glutathione S-transferase
MYTLHYVPDWASLAVRLVLEELEVPYESRLVNNDINERDTAEFRRLSPLGLIPALTTSDGPMFETAAILLWLADRHRSMAPAVDSPHRAAFLKWFIFTNNSIHNLILSLVHPERVSSTDSEQVTLELARKQVQHALALLDSMVGSDRPEWLSPERPSILAYYLALLMRWMNGFESGSPANISSKDYPNLHAILCALEERPAARRCAQKEGLGDTIFTKPTLV